MFKHKNWPGYLLAYAMWIVSFLIWAWLVFRSRAAISGLMVLFYLTGSYQRLHIFKLFNQWYFYFGGLVWLVLMIVVEDFFRKGVIKGNLPERICRVIGPELLLLFVFDAILLFTTSFNFLVALVTLVELVIGAGMIWYVIQRKTSIQIGKLKKPIPE